MCKDFFKKIGISHLFILICGHINKEKSRMPNDFLSLQQWEKLIRFIHLFQKTVKKKKKPFKKSSTLLSNTN